MLPDPARVAASQRSELERDPAVAVLAQLVDVTTKHHTKITDGLVQREDRRLEMAQGACPVHDQGAQWTA
jgi:hypothetical protein